jgi:hypothetical protein
MTLIVANRSSGNTSKNESDFIFIIPFVGPVFEFDTVGRLNGRARSSLMLRNLCRGNVES